MCFFMISQGLHTVLHGKFTLDATKTKTDASYLYFKIRNTIWTELYMFEPRQELPNNVVCATSKGSDQPVHTHSLIRAFASRLNIQCVLNYWLNTICSFKA